MKDISLLICSMAGLALLALTVLVILIANRKPAKLDPTDYGWVLLDDTAYDVLAYVKEQFVLTYLPELDMWKMYVVDLPEHPIKRCLGPLTDDFMAYLDMHIERYHD